MSHPQLSLSGSWRLVVCQYKPYDPSTEEHRAIVTMAFIDQAVTDIKKKLQRLGGVTRQVFKRVRAGREKVYHNSETEEEKEERKEKDAEWKELKRENSRDKSLQRILAIQVRGNEEPEARRQRPPIEKDQCVYCKEHG